MSTSRSLSARTRTLENIARGATNAVSRRTSLLGLGAAVLAVTLPVLAGALRPEALRAE